MSSLCDCLRCHLECPYRRVCQISILSFATRARAFSSPKCFHLFLHSSHLRSLRSPSVLPHTSTTTRGPHTASVSESRNHRVYHVVIWVFQNDLADLPSLLPRAYQTAACTSTWTFSILTYSSTCSSTATCIRSRYYLQDLADHTL